MARGDIARAFHELTKHTPESVSRPDWTMDWDNKPHPFKVYEAELERVVPAEPIGRILRLGAGVLRKRDFGDGTMYFRTYASAGALYPVEAYLVDTSGVYHFDPLSKDLERLRERGAGAGTFLVLTGIPWRTCWKYGNRGYRHLFWDAGTILANITAVASSGGLGARVVLGFDDIAVARLVGVDGVSEFPLCVVELGDAGELVVDPGLEVLELGARPLSSEVHRFTLLEDVHAAGRLDAADVQAWRGPDGGAAPPPPLREDVERVIRRRGSARRLGPQPIAALTLDEVIGYGMQPAATDYASGLIDVFVAVHAVEGLDQGTYRWDEGRLRKLWRRDVRLDAAYLCLGQRLGGEGAATVFLMADLEGALQRFGDRGYRVAQLEGGLALGRLDLAAHAHHLGATGLTFFDDEVRGFFSPEAAALDCMVVCAIGHRQGRLLPLA
jgi:SagB-type dehydrogenase family enzyme